MADQLPAWFVHALNDNAVHLAQQSDQRTRGASRVQDGVTGKSFPFNRIGSLEMVDITTRDGDTQYLNPTLSKRRAVLLDKGAAVLIDEFDTVKTLTNPQSEFMRALMAARARQMDKFLLAVPGLGSAGAAGTAVGGILGLATTVDEGNESSSTSALPASQQIVNGGTNLTMAKIGSANDLFDQAEVPDDERYLFYTSQGMKKLLTDSQVTSSDYSTIQALQRGGFPMDQTWMRFKWRRSQLLPKSGNIRSCIAVQRDGVGLAMGLFKNPEMVKQPGKWNNDSIILKISGGAVRIDDACVVQLDIDESA